MEPLGRDRQIADCRFMQIHAHHDNIMTLGSGLAYEIHEAIHAVEYNRTNADKNM